MTVLTHALHPLARAAGLALTAAATTSPAQTPVATGDAPPPGAAQQVEIVGTSDKSISMAIENAIAKASGSLRHLGWFEVGQIRGNIADSKVNRYQVTLKVGFTLE